MNNNSIRLAVVLCVFISVIAAADIWRRKQITSNWNYQPVRRQKDDSIALESASTKSLTGCAYVCSNIDYTVVPSLYFIPETGECVCNSAVDSTIEDKNKPELIYGTRESLIEIEVTDDSYERKTVWPYKQDCSEWYNASYHADGVYTIHPSGGYLTDVWCDMAKGGWTVIQRRMDGSENFYRGWNDYVTGFGNRTGEYWLGLENIYRLTQYNSQLYIYMEQYPEVSPPNMSAYYSYFKIGDLASGYELESVGFTGTCGDAMIESYGRPFSTYDNDNDTLLDDNCAEKYTGAWWYNRCHCSHLNGLYYKEGKYTRLEYYAKGIHWCRCWGHEKSSKFTVMEIKKWH